ncbi:MAG TPA: GNAT family protein [Polyangiaceae bacterium]|nr:GNAT family protein [Polyangiaceae bacterium]
MSLRASHDAASSPSLTTRVLTERLVLRPPRTTDVPVMRAVLRKNAEHLRPWSVAQAPGEDQASLTSVSRAILRHRREWKAGQAYVLFIARGVDPADIIGRVALGGVLRGAFQNAYLGYWIDVDHQGEGLMTEAVRAATAFAFESAGLHRVQAAVMPRNGASQRVLAKVGYRQEGFAARYLCIAGAWEDHLIFALTAEEWPARCGV